MPCVALEAPVAAEVTAEAEAAASESVETIESLPLAVAEDAAEESVGVPVGPAPTAPVEVAADEPLAEDTVLDGAALVASGASTSGM